MPNIRELTRRQQTHTREVLQKLLQEEQKKDRLPKIKKEDTKKWHDKFREALDKDIQVRKKFV